MKLISLFCLISIFNISTYACEINTFSKHFSKHFRIAQRNINEANQMYPDFIVELTHELKKKFGTNIKANWQDKPYFKELMTRDEVSQTVCGVKIPKTLESNLQSHIKTELVDVTSVIPQFSVRWVEECVLLGQLIDYNKGKAECKNPESYQGKLSLSKADGRCLIDYSSEIERDRFQEALAEIKAIHKQAYSDILELVQKSGNRHPEDSKTLNKAISKVGCLTNQRVAHLIEQKKANQS